MRRYKGIFSIFLITLGIGISGCQAAVAQKPVQPTNSLPTREVSTATIVADEGAPTPAAANATIFPSATATGVEPTLSPQEYITLGKDLTESICIVCHSSDRIQNSHKNRTEWEITVKRMVDHGAPLNEAQLKAVIEYLSLTYK